MMMYCPNCKCILTKNPKHAESVWQCNKCNGTFFIVATTKPDFINQVEVEPDDILYSRTTGSATRFIYKCKVCKTRTKSATVKRRTKYICLSCSRKLQNKKGRKRVGTQSLKKKLIQELGAMCQDCGKETNVMIHHIIPIREGGETSRENCTLLCVDCHKKKHGGQGVGAITKGK